MTVEFLTPLPSPSAAPPQQPSGTVTLFRDDNWNSDRLVLTTTQYRDGVRQIISGTNMQDAATWVAFNLPVGTVMTLMDDVTAIQPGHPVWDLSACGRCIDLVGTGKTVAVNLADCNMNDCVSAFFWRKVDLDLGAIELFDDGDFKGNRTTIFLSEWPVGKVNSIDGWWLAGRVSSARWKSLQDSQSMSLFSSSDGSGNRYENITAWGADKEIASLSAASFNDSMRSFTWQGLEPKREEIDPFTLQLGLNMENAESISDSHTVNNLDNSLPQTVTLAVKRSDSQTLTITETNTHVVGATLTYTHNWGIVGLVSDSLQVSLNYSYTHTETTTNSATKSIELDVSQQYTVPGNSNYQVSLVVEIGKLPPTAYTTTARRWYDQPVTGGVADPANNGWYMRVEKLSGTIAGGLAGKSRVEAKRLA